jgi:hypothetical protein
MISAFWHGFYPGYYIAFFFWGLMTTVTRFAYKASVNTKTFSIFDVNVVAGVRIKSKIFIYSVSPIFLR